MGAFTGVSVGAAGIQRANGVRSAMSMMYQLLRTGSHRAPSALAWSLSAKGVIKFILMVGIIPGRLYAADRPICRPVSLIEDKLLN